MQRRRGDARVLECFPHCLQQQTLLGIHRDRLERRDAEELGVEAVDVREEATALHVVRAGLVRVLVEVLVVVPAVARDGADRIDTVGKQVPVAVG